MLYDMSQQSGIYSYDVTQSLELLMDVRIINTKIGITKDISNSTVITPLSEYYDVSTQSFLQDSFSITPSDISYTILSGNVISTGAFSVIYEQFSEYVSAYFGKRSVGFSSLYDYPVIDHPIFDASALIHMVRSSGSSDGLGAFISDFSGNINVYGVTNILNNLCHYNPFNNRDISSTSVEGFKENDLIYAPSGQNIMLSVVLDKKAYELPPSNIGKFSGSVGDSQSTLFSSQNSSPGTFIQTNQFSTTTITQSYSVGILLRFANLS
jgi:hypothetical protein